MLSQILLSAGHVEEAEKVMGTPKDFDVLGRVTKLMRAKEAERRGEGFAAARGETTQLLAYGMADVHVARYLPAQSIGYRGGENFISDLVSPVVKVENATDSYVIFSRRDANKIVDPYISPEALPKQIHQTFAPDTFKVKPYALRSAVPNDILKNVDGVFDLLAEAADDVRDTLARTREWRVSQLLMTAGNYAAANKTALTGTTRWDVSSATSTADPIKLMLDSTSTLGAARRLNAAIIPFPVFTALRTHYKVLGSINGVVIGQVASVEQVKQLLGLDYLFVADARYDTQGEKPTANYDYMWGKGVLLFYLDPGSGRSKLSFAKTFRHQELVFERIEDRQPGMTGVTWVKGAHSEVDKIVAGDAAYLIDTVIS